MSWIGRGSNTSKNCSMKQLYSFKVINLKISNSMNSKQGEKMGHKGVSKRKAKKTASLSNNNISSNTHAGSPVQSLVKDSGVVLNRGDMKPAAASNKKNKKGK
jgi:hypothetical protein